MTPLETLQKYNLKTDVPSIKERIYGGNYFDGLVVEPLLSILETKPFGEVLDECRSADLALLFELAEKGERYEKAVKRRQDNDKLNSSVEGALYYLMTEIWEFSPDKGENELTKQAHDELKSALLRLESAEKELAEIKARAHQELLRLDRSCNFTEQSDIDAYWKEVHEYKEVIDFIIKGEGK